MEKESPGHRRHRSRISQSRCKVRCSRGKVAKFAAVNLRNTIYDRDRSKFLLTFQSQASEKLWPRLLSEMKK